VATTQQSIQVEVHVDDQIVFLAADARRESKRLERQARVVAQAHARLADALKERLSAVGIKYEGGGE
jgi:hypothetical protein